MEENNNFFGFVSKIGSLINNSNNKEKENKKKGEEKKYNIKISTDVDIDEDLNNIDNQSDEEEEEEEDEEEKKNEIEEDKNESIKKEESNIIQNESDLEKEKIKNIVQDIMNNNDINNHISDEEDEKEEKLDIDANNLDNTNNFCNINENICDNNKKICPPILNSSFPVMNNNSQENFSAFIYDETASCHIMLKKGNDFNINDYIIFPILFMEKQKNIFYKIGMMNNPKFEPKKYLFFFDEHYLYFAKDEIKVEEMDEETRRISKRISLFELKDFSNEHENEKFLIKLIIKKKDNKEKEIRFFVEEKYFSGFIKNFNLKLSIYGIDFFSNKKKF